MTNPYTETVDRSWHSGAGIVDSVASCAEALMSDSWVDKAFSGVALVVDAAATASDPLGSLIAAGLGWLMDHLEPLKGWLNDLTGNPEAVSGFALTWANVSTGLNRDGWRYQRILTDDLADMTQTGAVADYQSTGTVTAQAVCALGSSAEGTATALRRASMIVGFVHGVVRDVLAALIGSIISWALEAALSLGTATPWIIEQVTTRVSALTLKVSRSVKAVVKSCKSLEDCLIGLKAAGDELLKFLDKIVPNPHLREPRHALPTGTRTPEVRPWSRKPPEGYNPRPGRHAMTPREQAARNAREIPGEVGTAAQTSATTNAASQGTKADDEP